MTPMVVAVVLGSALLHALWNALAHTSKDRLAAITLIATAAGLSSAIALPFLPTPNRVVWPYIAVSTVLEVLYSFGLVLAYKLGEFGRMYPIARGTSPLVVALVATFVVGQPMSGLEALGIAVVSVGLVALALSNGLPTRKDMPAVLAALGTGCAIASYTVVDGVAVRKAGTVLGYSCWVFFTEAVIILGITAAIRRRAFVGSLRTDTFRGLGGGVISLTAYTLVLWAQTRGTLAAVATLRETSILIGAAIGALVLKEGFGRLRIAASASVVLGILLIAH
ncbi:MAG TPA: DMT family transporter [Actinospica sp.]|nr:DMT family transporter [Actinospica sp.]